MDKKSKLAMPEKHKYKASRDKFHGLIRLKPKNVEPKIIKIKKARAWIR